MSAILPDLTFVVLLSCMAIAALAGIVKGIVGFAMPMILISGLSSLMAPELALAGLILPTLVTNGMQALRQGGRAAWESVRRFRVFMLAGFLTLVLSAQLVSMLSAQALLLGIGVPVVLFALLQLAGWQPRLASGNTVLEAGVGALAGFIGGMSGIWGPPTVAYLTAIGTEKRDQVRIQGVIYGLGAVALALAHAGSGILTARTGLFSLALLPAAVAGMWLGGRLQDRIDQRAFRRATLVVLLLAGLNLIRRAVV